MRLCPVIHFPMSTFSPERTQAGYNLADRATTGFIRPEIPSLCERIIFVPELFSEHEVTMQWFQYMLPR